MTQHWAAPDNRTRPARLKGLSGPFLFLKQLPGNSGRSADRNWSGTDIWRRKWD